MKTEKVISVEDMDKLKINSKEWFQAAFDGMDIPEEIKKASILICLSYGIQGQADPGYIATVIKEALEGKLKIKLWGAV